MSVFVDTSALLAVLDHDDLHHPRARVSWISLIESDETLISTNYVFLECFALVQRRLGMDAARALCDDVLPLLSLVWIGFQEHRAALEAVLQANRRRLSLTDCSSFEMMRRLNIASCFAFDSHFAEQGFEVMPAAEES